MLIRFFHDIRKNKSLFWVSIVFISLAKICLALAPFISSKITDKLAENVGTGNFPIQWVTGQCIVLTVLYFIGNGADGIVNTNMVKISQQLMRKFRDDAQKKLNHLPLNYMDTHPAGDILSRVTNDVLTLSNTLESTVATMIGQMVLLVGVVLMMIVTDYRLTLIYVVVLPITFLVTSFISNKTKEQYKKQQTALGDLNGMVSDVYSNHLILKSFCCEKSKVKEFEKLNDQFYKTYVKSRFFAGFMIPTSVIANNISYIVLCVVGGMMLLKHTLTIGEFQAFLIYGNMVGTPMSSLASSMNNIQNGLTALGRIYEFLDEEEEPSENQQEHLDLENVQGSVEFDHVKFGYLPEKDLMKDVSLKAKPGMMMAVVGPSGAGKTTLINLLMRFYEINGGHIYLDGQDVQTLCKENLRSAFGMVLQDAWIFDGTIAENISYGKLGATREEIIAVSKSVQCDTFIDKLPDGYDTWISEENSMLSSGEKQLLAIARTVIANPQILILDEATSQVDTKTEMLITQAMENMMKNKTSFVIAHRLFTIKNADLILFMVDGDIKEVGTHDELMANGGLYAHMYQNVVG